MEKMTKKNVYSVMANYFTDMADTDVLGTVGEATLSVADFKEFCFHEISLLDKKASTKSSKPSAKQTENMAFKSAILEYLTANGKHTAGEIAVAVGIPTNQRCSALLKQLKDENLVVRSEEKKIAYFTVA